MTMNLVNTIKPTNHQQHQKPVNETLEKSNKLDSKRNSVSTVETVNAELSDSWTACDEKMSESFRLDIDACESNRETSSPEVEDEDNAVEIKPIITNAGSLTTGLTMHRSESCPSRLTSAIDETKNITASKDPTCILSDVINMNTDGNESNESSENEDMEDDTVPASSTNVMTNLKPNNTTGVTSSSKEQEAVQNAQGDRKPRIKFAENFVQIKKYTNVLDITDKEWYAAYYSRRDIDRFNRDNYELVKRHKWTRNKFDDFSQDIKRGYSLRGLDLVTDGKERKAYDKRVEQAQDVVFSLQLSNKFGVKRRNSDSNLSKLTADCDYAVSEMIAKHYAQMTRECQIKAHENGLNDQAIARSMDEIDEKKDSSQSNSVENKKMKKRPSLKRFFTSRKNLVSQRIQ